MGETFIYISKEGLYVVFIVILQFHHPISWSHIVELFMASRHNIESLTVVPKLKYEHVFLTSFSKMRVDLVAQVCKCILYVLLL